MASIITTEFTTHVVNVVLKGGTPSINWYAGLITSNGYTATAASTLATDLAGMAENSTAFGASRQQISGTVASGTLDCTATPPAFTNASNASVTVYGLFICNNAVTGNSNGVLLGVFPFTVSKTVAPTEILEVPFTIALT